MFTIFQILPEGFNKTNLGLHMNGCSSKFRQQSCWQHLGEPEAQKKNNKKNPRNSKIKCLLEIWHFFHVRKPHTVHLTCMFLTNIAQFKREFNRFSNIRCIAKKHCCKIIYQTQTDSLFMLSLQYKF